MTNPLPDSDQVSHDDAPYLDLLFQSFVEEVSAGRPIDPTPALRERPELADQIAELVEVARSVAVTRASEMPRVAGYDILCQIGRGGMSAVHLAVDQKLQRRVALKILTGARLVGEHGKERFRREVQTIARLSHPGIVKVHEGGEAEGVPYFAMEHVEGVSLAEAVRGLQRLAKPVASLTGRDLADVVLGPDAPHIVAAWQRTWVEAACGLVAEIGDALQHAHDHGVIHRDVKPSNVLVRRDGKALLCDFGLARVADAASMTLSGNFVGTPYYASPEQLAKKGLAVDARTDVYSLGVTLYELLTLTVPFSGDSTHEVLRAIATTEAPSPRRRNPQIPRDLETIVLTALEKEPARRYQTARELGDELRRVLTFQPISARPAGVYRRAHKWVRRKPAAAAALGLGALLLVGVPLGGWLQEKRAGQALQKQARRVQSFLGGMLGAVDPTKRGHDARIADSLSEAARRLDTEFADDVETQLILRETIADGYYRLGLHAEALPQYERCLATASRSEGRRSRRAIRFLTQIGSCQCHLAKLEEARRTIGEALQLAEKELGASDELTLAVRYELSRIDFDSGNPTAAEAKRTALLEGRTSTQPSDPLEPVRVAREKIGLALTISGRDASQALSLLDVALPVLEAEVGPEHPDVLNAKHNRGTALYRLGPDHYSEALQVLQEVLQKRTATLSAKSPDTIATQGVIANVYRSMGNRERALQTLNEAMANASELLPQQRTLLDLYFKRGWCRLDTGDAQGAREDLEHAWRGYQAQQQRDGTEVLQSRILLLRAIYRISCEEAEPLYREEHDWCTKELDPRTSERWILQADFGALLVKRQHFDEAEPLLVECEDRLVRLKMPGPTATARRALVSLYMTRDEPAKSLRYLGVMAPSAASGTPLERAVAAIDGAMAKLASDSRPSALQQDQVTDLRATSGWLRLHAGQLARAREDLEHAARELGKGDPKSDAALQVRCFLLRALAALGDLAATEPRLRTEHEWCRAELKPERALRWVIQASYGELLLKLGRHGESEALLVESEGKLTELVGARAGITRATRRTLVELYRELRQPEKVARYEEVGPESRAESGSRSEAASKPVLVR